MRIRISVVLASAALALAGCQQSDGSTTSTQETTITFGTGEAETASVDAVASVPAPDPSAPAGPPECERYFATVQRCLDRTAHPTADRAAMRQQLDAVREMLRQDGNPTVLRQACINAEAAHRQSSPNADC